MPQCTNMGACIHSRAGIAPEPSARTQAGKKLTRSQQRLVKKYLANFPCCETSTREHVRMVGAHWRMVFDDSGSSTYRRSTPSTPSTASNKSVRKKGDAVSYPARVVLLFDTFYGYLDAQAPHLFQLFQASRDAQVQIVDHVSGGIRAIVRANYSIDAVVALAKACLRFGVQPDHFDQLGMALMNAMKEVSGHYWTPQVDMAWRRVYWHSSVLLMEMLKSESKPTRPFKRIREKRLPKEYLPLMKKYLPNFHFEYESTEEHRMIAAAFWNKTFPVDQAALSTTPRSQASSWRSLVRSSSNSRHQFTVHAENQDHLNPIGILYDSFYEYLENKEPKLQQLFQSSIQTRSKVLLLISAGMMVLLATDIGERVAQLNQTHSRFGVQLDHFDPLGRALIHAMKECSEAAQSWSPEVENAWRRLFGHCSAILMYSQSNRRKASRTLSSRREVRRSLFGEKSVIMAGAGVNVGGGSSTGRVIFALCGGLAGAYYGFYLQSKILDERRVSVLVETEAQKRFDAWKQAQSSTAEATAE
ncbi:TPA: hypothetical protein N0F65_007565 [Lagenidium giganteum]|uniref:Globin domain-containing protein n=1 Tax=Lagenidium giganteum TaxID=4803 RepID=A0AAV2ZNM3_9STRA|nr:TPA: hypothetical protein N0F65_007565 [Lagenidium giganteum]